MTKLSKEQVLKKVINKLKRKNIKYLENLSYELSKKKVKETEYEQVPAKLIIEGRKYHTMVMRPKSNKEAYFFKWLN